MYRCTQKYVGYQKENIENPMFPFWSKTGSFVNHSNHNTAFDALDNMASTDSCWQREDEVSTEVLCDVIEETVFIGFLPNCTFLHVLFTT